MSGKNQVSRFLIKWRWLSVRYQHWENKLDEWGMTEKPERDPRPPPVQNIVCDRGSFASQWRKMLPCLANSLRKNGYPKREKNT